MSDEELDKYIDDVGRDNVLNILLRNGWGGSKGWPTVKWVWIMAAYQASEEKKKEATNADA